MSLMIDGVTVPVTGDFIKYNNTNIDKVVCNNTTVWEKQQDINVLANRTGWNLVVGGGSCYFSGNTIVSYDGGLRDREWKHRYEGYIDLSGYKRIRVTGGGYGDSAPNGGSMYMVAGIYVTKNGSRVITSFGLGLMAWASWNDDEGCEEDYQYGYTWRSSPFGTTGTIIYGGSGENKTSWQFTVDVSGITGNCFVQLIIDMYSGGTNANGTFRVTGLEFLST